MTTVKTALAGRLLAVEVIAGRAYCDEPDIAQIVNDAAARRQEVALTATGPFRYGLDGTDVQNVEYVAGVIAWAGFPIMETTPAIGSYDVPKGAIA